MREAEPLERERVEALLKDILIPVNEHYKRGPISRDRVLEVLNALAAAAALVIQGCDEPGEQKRRVAGHEIPEDAMTQQAGRGATRERQRAKPGD